MDGGADDLPAMPERLPLFVIGPPYGTCLKGRVVFPDQAEYADHYGEALAIHLRNGRPMPYATPGDLARHGRSHGKGAGGGA